MRCAHSVNIVCLHKFYIEKHIFFADSSPCIAIEFMPIYTFKNNPFTINLHDSLFKLKIELFDKNNKTVFEKIIDINKNIYLETEIDDVLAWSAEEPWLSKFVSSIK